MSGAALTRLSGKGAFAAYLRIKMHALPMLHVIVPFPMIPRAIHLGEFPLPLAAAAHPLPIITAMTR